MAFEGLDWHDERISSCLEEEEEEEKEEEEDIIWLLLKPVDKDTKHVSFSSCLEEDSIPKPVSKNTELVI